MTARKPPAPPRPAVKPTVKPAVAKRKPFTVVQDSDVELDTLLSDNVGDLIDPGYDGHRLRMAGKPWAVIAKEIGCPTPMAAVRMVSKYLREAATAQSAQQMQEALATQLDRYDAILEAWWPQALDGDEKAAGVVLRVMERQDRVLRLTDGDVIVTKESIVISANPEQYIQQLKGVVAERAVDAKKPLS